MYSAHRLGVMPRHATLPFFNGACIPIPEFNSGRFSVGPSVAVPPLGPHDVSESSKDISTHVILIVGITRSPFPLIEMVFVSQDSSTSRFREKLLNFFVPIIVTHCDASEVRITSPLDWGQQKTYFIFLEKQPDRFSLGERVLECESTLSPAPAHTQLFNDRKVPVPR